LTFLIFIYIINNNLSRNGEDIMLKTKNLPQCPVETTLMLIGDKWKVLILRDLLSGTKRFGELKKSVGNISQKVLTSQLRNMEKNGLIYRTVYAEVPPRVEYSLTKLGLSLKPILDVMKDWGENYQSQMCNN
jgi:DNA-binding HxlR family transcriptional regulator